MTKKLKTKHWIVPADGRLPAEIIAEAGRIIRSGGLVAFPTETVYGLGANALDPRAVKKIFRAKNRPADNPLIVHLGYKKDIRLYARNIPLAAYTLIRSFWPGALTLILPKQDIIPAVITCGLPTVAVRMPANPVALRLIRKAGVPVAAPSANRSGKPSPTLAIHVLEDLDGRIDAVLDSGLASVGIESTVLDMTADPPVILRPGFITQKQISRCIGKAVLYHADHEPGNLSQPKSPGMKYRHYAPDAGLLIVQGNQHKVQAFIRQRIRMSRSEKLSAGVLTTKKNHVYKNAEVIYIGQTAKDIGRNLFAALREFNRRKVDCIYSESIPEKDFGKAVMNRLKKAAGYLIIQV